VDLLKSNGYFSWTSKKSQNKRKQAGFFFCRGTLIVPSALILSARRLRQLSQSHIRGHCDYCKGSTVNLKDFKSESGLIEAF
jgi:hypothetical protein